MTNCLETLSIERIRRWGRQGALAVLDQGLFSGSNFALNVLLARWLTSSEYGAFSVAFAIYLFFTGFHNALILEPMTVLGPANHANRLNQYVFSQFRLHAVVTVILGILMAFLGVIFIMSEDKSSILGGAIVGAGIALPFMLLTWLVRRLFYILQQPGGALIASGSYALVLLAGLVFLRHPTVSHPLFIWFGLMGLAGLVSSCTVFPLQKRYRLQTDRNMFVWGELLKEHWHYGRWIVLATILYTIGSQAQVFLTAGLINLEAAGAWRALQNFTLPITQAVVAISLLGMPLLSAEFGRANFSSLQKKGYQIMIAMFIFTGMYELILWIFASPLEQWIYDGKYAQYNWLIPLLGLIPVLTAVATGYSLILRAIQRPQYYLIANAINALLAILVGVPMTRQWGIVGTMMSALLVSLVAIVVNIGFYYFWFPRIKIADTRQTRM